MPAGWNSAKTEREKEILSRVVHAFVELSNSRDLGNCRVAKRLRNIHFCRVACNSAHRVATYCLVELSSLALEAVYLLIMGLLLYLAQSELPLQLAKSEAPSRVVTHLLI